MTQTRWHPGSPRAEHLAQLWADPELSAAEIGRRMGVSKNSIIGAKRRLNLPSRALAPKQDGPHAQRREREAERKRARVRETDAAEVAHQQAEPETPVARGPAEPRIPPAGCQWPIGEPRTPGFRLCDAPRERIDRPYCDAHCKIAYGGRHG